MAIIKMKYSTEPRDRIYVRGNGFLLSAKNMGKSLSNKYGQKLPDSAKKSTIDEIKTASKKEQFKKQQKKLVIQLVTKVLIK